MLNVSIDLAVRGSRCTRRSRPSKRICASSTARDPPGQRRSRCEAEIGDLQELFDLAAIIWACSRRR